MAEIWVVYRAKGGVRAGKPCNWLREGRKKRTMGERGWSAFSKKWKGIDLDLSPLRPSPPPRGPTGPEGGVREKGGSGVGGPGALCPISRKRRRGSVVPFFLGQLLTPSRQVTFAFGEIREGMGGKREMMYAHRGQKLSAHKGRSGGR